MLCNFDEQSMTWTVLHKHDAPFERESAFRSTWRCPRLNRRGGRSRENLRKFGAVDDFARIKVRFSKEHLAFGVCPKLSNFSHLIEIVRFGAVNGRRKQQPNCRKHL